MPSTNYAFNKATHPPASTILKRDATYLIVGGTGGIGRAITKRMVDRGARNIVLLSRTGSSSSELKTLVSDSQVSGSSVYIKQCDVADKGAVETLVAEVQKTMPPIRGLIHAAMVLRVSDCLSTCTVSILTIQRTFFSSK